jgi:FkbM family methyltransferase
VLRRFAAELLRFADLREIVPKGGPRLRLAYAWVVLSLKQRLAPRARLRCSVTWSVDGRRMQASVGDTSELRVIREMFVLEEYDLPATVQPSAIVDLGSNAGLSVLFFKNRYPDARILAVEPVPHVFERLRHNTAHLPGVTLVNAAVTDHNGPVALHTGAKSWTAAQAPHVLRPERLEVNGITLDTLLERNGFGDMDLLKMDIEGAEVQVLSSSQAARRCRMLVFEFHQEHSPGTVWDLLESLPDHHLVRFRDDSEKHPLLTLSRGAGRGSLGAQ